MRTGLWQRFRALFRRGRLERELNEEIRTHIEMATAENIRSGMAETEARQAARRSFGGVEQVKEEYRWTRGLPWLETLAQDIGYGLRTLARTPAFTFTALVTLAVGIGATTAVFSIVYAVLLRALPYSEPERLVWITSVAKAFPSDNEFALVGDFVEFRERAKSFSHIAANSTRSNNFADEAGAERIVAGRVTPGFLATLGVQPALGRGFLPDEEGPGGPRVVILTHGFWQERFGGDATALGRDIMLSGEPYEVVGVLPANFVFPRSTAFDIQLLQPQVFDAQREKELPMRYQSVVGRLAPNVSREEALAELNVIRAQRDVRIAETREWGLSMIVRPLHEELAGDVRAALLILFGAVVFVLWITCLNVANLLLARSGVRRREMAIRGALGAGRVRLLRQLLTESALLAGGGCLAGIALSVLLRQGLAAIRPAALYHSEISDAHAAVLLFAVVLSSLAAIAFGIAPALAASGFSPMASLKAGTTHSSATRGRRGLLNSLVVAQLTLAMVLLVAAGLMVQSFQRLRFQGLGFRTEGVLTAYIYVDRSRHPDDQQRRLFFERLFEGARALPGVERVALAAGLPPSGMSYCSAVYGELSTPPEKVIDVTCTPHQAVSPDYFAALEIPLMKGRPFRERELEQQDVAVVNSSFAKAHFGSEDPIGKRFRPPRGDHPWRTVVGVVADTKNRGMAKAPEPHVYVPFGGKIIDRAGSFIVTTSSGDVSSFEPAMRQLIRELDPQQAVANIETLDQRLTREVSRERFLTWVLTAFACLAVALAAIGVYGVVAYMVQQRRQEMGVRLALGAQPADILRSVLGHGMKLLAVGTLLGLAGSLAATRVLESYLFEIGATDWKTFVLAAAGLAAIGVLACYWPARRASRTDPLSALRYE